jgi:hypothetical protein
MAGSPEVTVRVKTVPPLEKTTVVNPARGAKLGSYYRAAVRRSRDRDYVPTDVWSEG